MEQPISTIITKYDDDRGWFISSFHELHPTKDWKMQNTSFSQQNTLRGLHLQSPRSQAKLVTVLDGSITDVILDIDPKSKTYGQWQRYELCSKDTSLPNQLYVPNHYAHGFAVTSETALISYLTDELYYPEDEISIHPLSPNLSIPWGIEDPILSDKDANAEIWNPMTFKQ